MPRGNAYFTEIEPPPSLAVSWKFPVQVTLPDAGIIKVALIEPFVTSNELLPVENATPDKLHSVV